MRSLALFFAANVSTAFAQQDPLTIRAGLTEARDDNIFRLAENSDLPAGAQRPGPRADLIRSAVLGVNYTRDISLQHISFDANVANAKYRDHPELDNTSDGIKANWLGAYGRRVKNDLGIDINKQLSNFSDIRSTSKNIVKTRSIVDALSYAITPEFSAVAGVGTSRTENSAPSSLEANHSTTYRELGLLYTTRSSNQIKLNYRTTNGNYPNPQTVSNAVGGQQFTVSNSFVQQDLDLSTVWLATGISHFSARLGYTRRHYDDFASRDFNGTTGALIYSWDRGGKLTMVAELRRAIGLNNDVTPSYLLTDTISLRPTWTPTGKITVTGNLDWTRRNPLGDPLRSIAASGAEKDRTKTLGLAVSYRPIRRVELALNLRDERRQSDIPAFGYVDRYAAVTANITY